MAAWCNVLRPARSPTRPAPTSSRTPRAGSSTSARPSRLRQRLSNYFQNPGYAAPAHRADGGDGRDGRVDPGPQRGRGAHARVQPHQAAPAAVQHPAARRQELPVPRRHPRRRVAPGDGDAGRASARASATSGPTATPTPSARRSTCCCARSRSAPARDNKFDRHERLGRPCLLFHIEKCAGPCVGEIDKPSVRRAGRASCSTSSTATPTTIVKRLERQMRDAADELEFERAARLRDRLDRGAQGHREAADGGRPQRGPRRRSASPTTSSRPRCRCSSCAGAGWSAARASSSTRSRTSTPAELVDPHPRGALLRRAAARRAQAGAGAGRARRPRRCTRSGCASSAGSQRRRSGCRSGATSGRCWRRSPATPRRSSPATGCGGRPTTTAGPGRSTSCRTHLGLPEAPLRIECYDMSHIQGTDYVGSMVVLEDGLPKKSEYRRFKVQERRRATTTSPPWRRCSPAGSPPTSTSGDRPVERAAGQVRLPAAAAAGRRRQGPAGAWPSGCSRSSGLEDEIPVASLAKRFEEVYVPGPGRAGPHPAPVRGALPAAAHPRRGPPLRHHLPPRAAGQAHDQVGARRHPRPRPDPQEAPASRSSAASTR